MKKVIVWLFLFLIIPASVLCDSFDPALYSQEELLRVKSLVDASLNAEQMGEVVYSEEGITITWIGIVEEERYYKADLLISNATGRDISVDLCTIAFNGIKLPITNTGAAALEDGLSLPTGAYNHWLVSKKDAVSYGIQTITTVSVVVNIIDESVNKYEPIQTAKINVCIEGD